MSDRRKKEPTIAEAFRELEKITAAFEEQTIDLEDGVAQFERGLELVQYLRKRLGAVSERVKVIEKKFRDLAVPDRDRSARQDE